MFLQTFRILPWQLGSAGLLAFGTALGGGYMMMAPGTTQEVWVPATKSISLAMPTDAPAGALKEELNRLILAQKQAEEKLAQVKQESTDLQKRHEQQQGAMRKQQESAGTPLPEEELLKTYLAKPPAWQDLGLTAADLNLVSHAWNAPASDRSRVEKEAAELLEKTRQQVVQQAELEKTGLKKTLEERRSMLVALKTGVEKKEMELVSSLDLSGFKDDEMAALKAAITGLMQGTLWAVPGKNFINSTGMEMVWMALQNGGFWIGRSEVKMDEMRQVLPVESGNCGTDDEGRAYRVLYTEADKFCRVLTEKERSGAAPSAGQIAPEGWSYGLPSSGHWSYAYKRSEPLGVMSMRGGVSEWVSDSPTQSNHRMIMGTSPGSNGVTESTKFPVPDNRSYTLTSNAGANQGIQDVKFQGRVGFRVVLLPPSTN